MNIKNIKFIFLITCVCASCLKSNAQQAYGKYAALGIIADFPFAGDGTYQSNYIGIQYEHKLYHNFNYCIGLGISEIRVDYINIDRTYPTNAVSYYSYYHSNIASTLPIIRTEVDYCFIRKRITIDIGYVLKFGTDFNYNSLSYQTLTDTTRITSTGTINNEQTIKNIVPAKILYLGNEPTFGILIHRKRIIIGEYVSALFIYSSVVSKLSSDYQFTFGNINFTTKIFYNLNKKTN